MKIPIKITRWVSTGYYGFAVTECQNGACEILFVPITEMPQEIQQKVRDGASIQHAIFLCDIADAKPGTSYRRAENLILFYWNSAGTE